MTNKELQEKLKEFPEDMEIGIFRNIQNNQILCGNPILQEYFDILLIK